MNETYLNVLLNHKKQIEHFIAKYELLLAENMRLKEKINGLENDLEDCNKDKVFSNNKIKELEQKIDKMQLTGAFVSTAVDVKEAKQNINKLIREIDKCILLLNDE